MVLFMVNIVCIGPLLMGSVLRLSSPVHVLRVCGVTLHGRRPPDSGVTVVNSSTRGVFLGSTTIVFALQSQGMTQLAASSCSKSRLGGRARSKLAV